MNTRFGLPLLATGMLALAACGFQPTDTDSPPAIEESRQSTGMALTMDIHGDTDVAGFRFRIKTCDGKLVVDKTKDLEDLQLPGMIPEFVDRPFDANSSHLFSDYFMVLAAGCYDVFVQPVTHKGSNSEDCSAAMAKNVHVYDGVTTEIMLISQCKGPERGALDTIAALNHPPVIKSLVHDPSKFVFECEKTKICVTASDPNNDPLQFVWKKIGNTHNLHSGPTVIERHEQGGQVTECMRVVPLWPDNYEFKVTVYDMFRNEAGQLERAENFTGKDSHASLVFPLYTNWDVELQCYDAKTKSYHHFPGVREIDRAPGCYPIWPSQFYCSDYYWDDTATSCPGGEFKPETIYPSCELLNR
ncbi:MAG: hypothetical protein H0U74_00700 [Bradymonadaceae bacterium]|nr:hypothetical protein [Lujinxingiaceae bacterium]